MKNIQTILSHIKFSPEFKKINTQQSLTLLINALPQHLKNGVKFAYTKNMILFFVLKHPVFKNEFKNNISLIKALLKDLKIANIEKIEFFVTHSIEKRQKKTINETPSYPERSYAIFDNHAHNEKLHQKFEHIRNIIKEHK
ncbi:MAG: DUF721 domain-containing protein [Campylobacterota bacterium]|nr:DUF721 domain-containing protein [Campylobacterota bacterium]